jgi:exopolysaccharide biosynthesis polyprenyl glycosylphosphotransferase
MLRRSSAKYVLILFFWDLAATALALWAARWLRQVSPWGRELDAAGSALYWPMFVMAALIWGVALTLWRVYDAQRIAQQRDELWAVFTATAAATLAFAGLLYLSYRGLSRLLFLYFFVFDLALGLCSRVALRRILQRDRAQGTVQILVVGAGSVGRQVVSSLKPCAWLGIQVAGLVDDDLAKVGSWVDSSQVLGGLDEAAELVRARGIHEVIIALPLQAHQRLQALVAELQQLNVNIKVVPDYSESVFYRSSLEQLGGLLFIGLKEPVIGPIDRLVKRAFDVAVAGSGLFVLSPALLLIALLVKVTSPGPVLYRSARVGEGGSEFAMLKFRTMRQDAERSEAELVHQTADGRVLFEKRPDDPRITPLGRFLRRYSLDELPQLINVLCGQMSLVGPRPELPSLVRHYEPWQRKRFGVPQGMTGWWQISGRSSKAKYLHVEDDLYYIRNYSLLLDLRIIARTLGAVLRGEGAF